MVAKVGQAVAVVLAELTLKQDLPGGAYVPG